MGSWLATPNRVIHSRASSNSQRAPQDFLDHGMDLPDEVFRTARRIDLEVRERALDQTDHLSSARNGAR